MKRNLSLEGDLTMTQAQSISNLMNQRCIDINGKITLVNNFSTSFTFEGKAYNDIKANPMPENILELLKEKGKLHGCQAYLMEAIKLKNKLMQDCLDATELYFEDKGPTYPTLKQMVELNLKPLFTEADAWSSMTDKEYNEYLENQAMAAHYGQYIHAGGTLDKLRKELPTLTGVTFINIMNDQRTPVERNIHHDADKLFEFHTKISELHREYEMRVNNMLAKIKTLVSEKNNEINNFNKNEAARVGSENALISRENAATIREAENKFNTEKETYRINKLKEHAELSKYKIVVPENFKELIDEYRTKIDSKAA